MATTDPDDGDLRERVGELPPLQLYVLTAEQLLATADRWIAAHESVESVPRDVLRALLAEWSDWSGDELDEAVIVTMWGARHLRGDRG